MVRLQNLAATPLPNLLSNATFGAAAALHAPANPKTPRPFLDATTHHGLEEMQTLELKKLEVQINTQKMYNQQLVKQNSRHKHQVSRLNEVIQQLEEKQRNYYTWHFDHWDALFQDYRQNCDFELARKQQEIERLTQTISNWARSYLELQKRIDGEPQFIEDATSTAKAYLQRLTELCIPGSPQKVEISSISLGTSFAPRSSSCVKIGRGDQDPADIENDDDFAGL